MGNARSPRKEQLLFDIKFFNAIRFLFNVRFYVLPVTLETWTMFPFVFSRCGRHSFVSIKADLALIFMQRSYSEIGKSIVLPLTTIPAE